MLCTQLYQAEWGGTDQEARRALAEGIAQSSGLSLGLVCVCVLPKNQVMAGWQQGLEELPREDFSTFPCGQTPELAPVRLCSLRRFCASALRVSAANRKLTALLGESQE